MSIKHLGNRGKADFQGVFFTYFLLKCGGGDLQKKREYSMIRRRILMKNQEGSP